jgi:hypothetical protein
VTNPDQTVRPEMTRREYFAIKILAGFAADPNCDEGGPVHAEAAVRWADALIAELNKPTEAKP